MSIKTDLLSWDGKSSYDITVIYDSHKHNASFTNDVIKLISDRATENGASWLLKHLLESGESLTAQQTASVYQTLPLLEQWQAKLHILQCMPYMPVASKQKPAVESFVRTNLTADNKFVRAWSYNGFHELARQYPEYQEEALSLIEMGMQDEPASVQARLRKIKKTGFTKSS